MRSISCAGTPSVMQMIVADARVDRLVHRVGRERRRDEDHRRVRAGLRDRRRDGVEDRDPLDVLPALARASRRRRPACRARGSAGRGSDPRAGQPLDDEPRVGVDEDRHQRPPPPAPPRVARRRASSPPREVRGAASRSRRRPSSAFVPSRRTTIGSLDPICSSACRIPRATSSQRVIPPKMLKKIERTCGSLRDDLERVDDTLRVAAAAEVAEVRRPAADERDDVDGGHRQPRAVPEHADLAVELHVRDALLARQRLQRVGGADVAHLGEVRVPEERVVVDGELRVERAHLAVRSSRSAG